MYGTLLMIGLVTWAHAARASEPDKASRILAAAGVKRGVVVHLHSWVKETNQTCSMKPRSADEPAITRLKAKECS
jgi:hypothetical protein